MLLRQPVKLIFIESSAPISWNTTSVGANQIAITSGSISARTISTPSSTPMPPIAAIMAGVGLAAAHHREHARADDQHHDQR